MILTHFRLACKYFLSLLKNHEISNYRSIEVNVIKNQTEFLCHVYICFIVKEIALHCRKKRNFFSNLSNVCS